MYSRRDIIKSGSLLTFGASIMPQTIRASTMSAPLFPLGYPDRQSIIQAAIDVAVAGGASYCDARMQHSEHISVVSSNPARMESMTFGVRVLYEGYWGFASSPLWSIDEAQRLANAALDQAKFSVLGRTRDSELAPIPGITSGDWIMPVTDDPFEMAYDEMWDFIQGAMKFVTSLKHVATAYNRTEFVRSDKAFGSSLNQYVTQRTYFADGNLSFTLKDGDGRESGAEVEHISASGMGFEHFRGIPLRDYIRSAHEEALEDLSLPIVPVDVGRHEVLMDAYGVARLVNQSLGVASEVDRVFGLEANGGGTSYIDDPDEMLGQLKLGSPLLNVTGGRSIPGSVGRVKWDDEGVQPVDFDLIKSGVLANLQTNREGASWIQDHLKTSGQTVQSFGCSRAPSGIDAPLVHQADLSITPAASSDTQDSMRADIEEGIEIRLPNISLDFQKVTGFLNNGRSYQVKKGKRVSRLADVGVIFRTPEIWNGLTRVGGENSVIRYGIASSKGQPEQTMYSSVYSVPCQFRDVTVIDAKRKG